jgi:GxxExxY protein
MSSHRIVTRGLNAEHQHSDLTEKIIGCAYRVYNRMGSGFAESVYERWLAIELRKSGLKPSSRS